MSSPLTELLRLRTEAEKALEISTQCQRNCLFGEAVISTVEALSHIEMGLLIESLEPEAEFREEKEHLQNLQMKAHTGLDVCMCLAKTEARVEQLNETLALMRPDTSGQEVILTVNGVVFQEFNSSRDAGREVANVKLELVKITSPRLIFFIRISSADDGTEIWITPLLEDVGLERTGLCLRLANIATDGSVSLTLPASAETEDLFNILEENSISVRQVEIPEGRAAKYSNGLVRGASLLSMGLVKGAEKTGEFLSFGTPYVISKMVQQPDASAPVGENWKNAAHIAKNMTSKAASVTGFCANKIGTATTAVGRFLAPHVQTQGTRLLSNTAGLSTEDASQAMSNVLTMTAGAVEAVATVYNGVEESARIVGSSLSTNSERIIEHKYGPSAANLASDTFETVGNVYTITQNTKVLQPKNLVKSVAKNTGKGIVQDFKPTTSTQSSLPPAPPPPPPPSSSSSPPPPNSVS